MESMHASVKFEGLDGVLHKDWDMRFNLTQHAETYQGLGMNESISPVGYGCRPATIMSRVVHGHPKPME